MKAAGTQSWRDLLFLHWPMRPEDVRPALPAGLRLHLWDKWAWVGVVAFSMHAIRPTSWWPGAGMRFLETNVRTYVSHRGGPPAVWFFSLDAASRFACTAARATWGLPYFAAEMSHEVTDGEHRYRTVRRGRGAGFAALEAHWTPTGTPAPAAPGTLDHFLVEQYDLYSVRRGKLLRGRVEHPPYAVQGVDLARCNEDLVHAAGLNAPSGPPVHACYSPGVDVSIFGPERVPESP